MLPEGVVGLSSGALMVVGCLMQNFLVQLDQTSASNLQACKTSTLKPKHVKAALYRIMHPREAQRAGTEAQHTTEKWIAFSKESVIHPSLSESLAEER